MDEPYVKVDELDVLGSQEHEVVQQCLVYVMPDESSAITVTEILELNHEREVGLKLIVGASASKTILIASESTAQLPAASQQRT